MTVTGDTAKLHPTFLLRLEDLSTAAGIGLSVTSGGRTRIEQQALVNGYAARCSWPGGRDNPANPFRRFNPANPVGTSRHEEQPDGWAYAADLAPAPGASRLLARLLPAHRLVLTHSREPWHVEPIESLLPTPLEDDVPNKVRNLSLNVHNPQDYAHPAWRTVRGLLAAWGFKVTPDDANGQATRDAVIAFTGDGVFGPVSWKHALAGLQ